MHKNREEKHILVLIISEHKKLIKGGYLSRQGRKLTGTKTRQEQVLLNLHLIILVGFVNHVNIAPMPNKISTLPPISITIITFKRLAKKDWVRGRFTTHRESLELSNLSHGNYLPLPWKERGNHLQPTYTGYVSIYMSSHLIFKLILIGITSPISPNKLW